MSLAGPRRWTLGTHARRRVVAVSIGAVLPLLIAGCGGDDEPVTHAYVTNASHHTVSVIDTATNAVITTIPVGSIPKGVAVTPNGRHAYVANSSSGSVSVIDTATHAVTATVPVGFTPQQIAIAPDGTRAYVTNLDPASVVLRSV